MNVLRWMLLLHCIYGVSNCCLSVSLNIVGLQKSPGKMLWVSWKSPRFFCKQESGNPVNGLVWQSMFQLQLVITCTWSDSKHDSSRPPVTPHH